jgi:hypothetical protein
MKMATTLAVATLLTIGAFSDSSATAQVTQGLTSRIIRLIESYNRVEETIGDPVEVVDNIKTALGAEEAVQSALADGLYGQDMSALRAQYGVHPFDDPRPPAPSVSASDLANGGENAERALALLQEYAAALTRRQQAISEALQNAERMIEELEALQKASGDAAHRAYLLANIHGRPEVVAMLHEYGLLDHYLDQNRQLSALSGAATNYLGEWEREVARLTALRDREAVELANLMSNLDNVIKPAVQANRGKNPRTLGSDINREVRLSSLHNLPLEFSGIASDTEFSTTYSGTRNGPSLRGSYSGSEGSGIFSGVIDRLMRVRGQYKDDSSERGSFIGRTTPALDRVIGSINCISNCD